MAKFKKKNILSPKVFNYLYSIGAAVVILGSLFKLLHLPGADGLLILGMGTEAFIFFMSAFDEPSKDYHWENVFPVLDNKDATPADAPEFASGHVSGGVSGGGTTIIGGSPVSCGTIVIGGGAVTSSSQPSAGEDVEVGEGAAVAMGSGVTSVGGNVNPLGGVAMTGAQADAVTEATTNYVSQLNEISASLAKLQAAMQGLGEASEYAEQMTALGKNIQGLNTMFEIQLRSVSSQLDTIEKVNQGLSNIRSLYENGQNDSYRIRQETDHMARTLQQLNEVYERMLQALTINMGFHAAQPQQPYGAQPQYGQPAQPVQPAQQPYGAQPQYGQPSQPVQPQGPLYAQQG